MNPIYILVLGGTAAFILLIIGVVVSIRSERSLVDERLGSLGKVDEPKVKSGGKKTSPLTEWLNRRVERSTFGERIAKMLARADLKLKGGEFMAIMVIASIFLGGLLFYLTKSNYLFAAVGAVVGAIIPLVYVQNQQGKRLIRFNEQLPDMLNLMVNGLRAGYSTLQSMEAISKELPPPISEEFRRVVQEQALGIDVGLALENLVRRIPSDDLDLVITAMKVQREVGGNLAEILDTISYTIRERVRIKGEIRTLTAQQKYSGRFLALMPIIVVGILYLLNPSYMQEFILPSSQPCGYISLAVVVLLITSGYFAMNKLSDIEI
jgi:tight adherence protein B